MNLRRSDRLRQKLASQPVMVTMKSLDDLPGEIILKIGELLPDVDLVSFSHANLRIFKIFSTASLIWKRRLDNDDQKYCDKMRQRDQGSAQACPEKEMFFRRSKSERNWRKNNFKIIGVLDIARDIYHLAPSDSLEFSFAAIGYRDFYVNISCNRELQHLNITLVDLSRKGGIIQSGTLQRKKIRSDIIDLHVFAASKSILIVLQTFGFWALEFKRVNESSESQISEEHKNSLFAIDLTRAETPRVLWEHSTLVNYSMHINVANFKIYKLETNPDGSTVFSILSPETGQTISTWPSNLFEMVRVKKKTNF